MKPAFDVRSIQISRTLVRLLCVTAIAAAILVTVQVMSALFQLLDLNSLDQIWYLSWLS
ncbi:MAG TPA: hypothetical protein VD789_13450 [Thermomicrobiales bacterium]|nr:hypothetical protein [Thermomicrobiales bacterium]